MRFKLLPVFLLAYAVVMASADENADESSSSTEPPSSTASSTASPTEPPSSTASSTASPTEPPSSTASSTASPTEPPSSTASSTASPTEPPSSTASSTASPTEPPSSTASSTASPTEPPSSTASSTASPTEPPTSTASPTEPSSSTASPTEPSSSTASPTEPSSSKASPTEPSSSTASPTEPSSSTASPTEPSSSTASPTEPSSSTASPTEPSSSTTSSTESSSSTTSSTTSSTEPSSSTVSQNGWDDYPIHVPGEAGKPPCIFSKMNISLTVTYEKKDNTNTTSTVFVPKEVSPSGSCNDTVSIMTLSWAVPPKPQTRYAKSFYNLYADDGNEITFHFKKDNSSIKVSQIDINILLDSVNYPDAKNPRLTATTGDTLNLFATSPEGKRYVCNTETVVSTNSGGVELTITDVNLIAFNQEEDLKQISEENCLNEETIESANVGAIVGGIIAAVVVVGIVGFIIWRRRRNSYAHSEVA